MSTTATQPLFDLFAEQQPGSRTSVAHAPGPKTEAGKDAGSKLYANAARHEDAASRRFAGADLTLGERMSGVWEGLLRTGTADCPVCRGPMERAGDRGHCLRCGSILS
jgi:hypothetical protein